MKKVALTLAAVAAATVFAPEASAVPVFARQTGMACLACHFQHFPLLNGFGRAFKAGGFTMIGGQAKVEGDQEGIKLDMPDRLNMGVFATTYYQKEGGAGTNQAQWGVPSSGGELSIFFGGRGSEYMGFLSELGTTPPAGAGAAKMAMLFPVGDARVGFVSYTGGQGAAYSFELLNTGAADTHKMVGNSGPNKQHVAALYAGSYLGTRVDATGIQLVANNDKGFVTAGSYASAPPGTGNASALTLTYVRAAGLFDMAGWDMGAGIQQFMGTQANADYAATVVDLQAQGELAGMSTGLYVTFGSAPAIASSATAPTASNKMAGGWSTLVKNGISQDNLSATSLNMAASVEVMHGATVQAGMRFATLTDNKTVAAGAVTQGGADNAIVVGATYDIAQNIALGVNYTMQSGSAWDNYKTNNGKDAVGKTATTVLLETLF